MRISTRLSLAFLGVALTATLSLGGVSYMVGRDALLRQAHARLEAIAAIQQQRLEALLAQNRERLLLVASRTQLRLSLARFLETPNPTDRALMIRILRDARAQIDDFGKISIHDAGGALLVSTDGAGSGLPAPTGALGKDAGQIHVDRLFAYPGGEPGIRLSAPLSLNDRVLGRLVIEATGQKLLQLVRDYTGLGSTGETLLIGRNGDGEALFLTPARFARDTAFKRALPMTASDSPVVRSLQATAPQMVSGTDYRGVRVLAAVRPMPRFGWGLLTKIDQSEVLAPVRSLVELLSYVILAIAALVIAASLLIARSLCRPLIALTQTARAVTGGDLSRRAEGEGTDEIGTLASSFNAMTVKLISGNRAMAEHVAELQRYEQVVSTSGDMLAFVDRQQRYLLANPAYAAPLNSTPASLIGHPIEEAAGPLVYREIAPHLERALAGEAQYFVLESLFPDGEARVMNAELRPCRRQEEVLGVVINLRNITADRAAREALRASEKRFQVTFEQAAVGIGQVAPNGRWLRVNRKLCSIIGYRPEELLALTFQDITHPEDLDNDLDHVRRMLAGELDTYALEKRYLHKDGPVIWINLTVSLVRRDDGSPDYFIAVIEEIQARKQAEEALRDREQKLGAIVAHSPSALSLKHPDGRYALANPNLQRLHRLSEAQIIGRTDFDLYPAETAQLFRANDEKVIQSRERHSIEEIVPVNGEPRVFMSHMFPVLGDDGAVCYICRISLDITERKRAEETLRNSEAALRQAQQLAGIGNWSWDVVNDIHSWSDEIYRIYGRDPALPAAVYPEVREYFTAESWERLAAAVERGLEEGIPYVCDAEVVRPDGSHRWIVARGEGTRDAQGKLINLHGTVQDITERKLAEQEIRQLNADLERRVAERTAELSAANRELDAFAYAVSHDLRAPLRAMGGFSQALMEDFGGQLQEEARGYLRQIELASQRMGKLIDALLALSRISRGQLQRQRVDLGILATQLLEELEQGDPQRRVSWSVEPEMAVEGDPGMLEVVMRNLLGNAWKYTARTPEPNIRVHSEPHDGGRRICVTDNGAGFDMSHAARLFAPFQRLHRQEEFEGLGIGLATVQRIVHRHGGQLEGRGETGQGAQFCFSLPGRVDDRADDRAETITPNKEITDE